MNDHDLLIDTLVDDADPIRRLAAPALRALAWTPACLAVGWIATSMLQAPWSGFGTGSLYGAVNLTTAGAAGVFLLVAAFELSIAGRRSPALFLSALCIAAWSVCCVADLATRGWPLGRMGEGAFCFRFVLFASAPMAVLVGLALRRTYSVRPLRTTLLGAAGTCFLAFALLALCDHGRLHLYDFSMHLAAAALVIVLATAAGWRWLSIPAGRRL